MITKEILASMTAEQVAQLFTEAKQRRLSAAANANAAIKGYEKSVSLRDAKIRELKDDLIKQLSDITDKAEALKPVMLQATISGDSAELNRVQQALADLERQRSQLNTQLEFLSGKPPRCDDAYEAMEAAVAESKKADAQYEGEARIIRETCEEAIKPWKEIISSLSNRGEVVSQFYLDRIRSRYSSERRSNL